jgi:hypothetical protein
MKPATRSQLLSSMPYSEIRSRPVPAPVDRAIQIVSGRRVVLGPDLARIYGVETRALAQAVKRNADQFPRGFRISSDPAGGHSDHAFDITICDLEKRSQHQALAAGLHRAWGGHGRERSQKRSCRSLEHFVVRAFLRLREWSVNQAELSARVTELERRVGDHNHELRGIIEPFEAS